MVNSLALRVESCTPVDKPDSRQIVGESRVGEKNEVVAIGVESLAILEGGCSVVLELREQQATGEAEVGIERVARLGGGKHLSGLPVPAQPALRVAERGLDVEDAGLVGQDAVEGVVRLSQQGGGVPLQSAPGRGIGLGVGLGEQPAAERASREAAQPARRQ